MKTANEPIWRRVQDDHDRRTERLDVPGGWLYCVKELGDFGSVIVEFVVFVPKAAS